MSKKLVFAPVAKPLTLTEQVTETLRNEIVSGRLRPGEPLRPNEIALELGVSRVPVREALQRLAATGLVELRSNRAAVVTNLTEDDIEELIGISSALERLASCKGVLQMSPKNFEQMTDLLDEMKSNEDDPIEWYRLNGEFHACMYDASGYGRMTSILEDCRQNVGRYITDRELHARKVSEWHEEHVAIHEAAQKRDTELLDRLITEHFANAVECVRPYLKDPNETAWKG